MVVDLGLGAGTPVVGGHGLPQHRLRDLPVHVGGQVLEDRAPAPAAAGPVLELDPHRVRDGGGGVGPQVGQGGHQGADVLVPGAFGVVPPQPQRVAEDLHEGGPVGDGVGAHQVGPGGDPGQPAPGREPALEPGAVDDPLERFQRVPLVGAAVVEQAQGLPVLPVPAEVAGVAPEEPVRGPGRAFAVPEDLDRGPALAEPVEQVVEQGGEVVAADDLPDRFGQAQVFVGVGGGLDGGLQAGDRAAAGSQDRGVVGVPLLDLLGEGEEVPGLAGVGGTEDGGQPVRGEPEGDGLGGPGLADAGGGRPGRFGAEPPGQRPPVGPQQPGVGVHSALRASRWNPAVTRTGRSKRSRSAGGVPHQASPAARGRAGW